MGSPASKYLLGVYIADIWMPALRMCILIFFFHPQSFQLLFKYSNGVIN